MIGASPGRTDCSKHRACGRCRFLSALVGVGFSVLNYLGTAPNSDLAKRATHACAVYRLYWTFSYLFLMRNWFMNKGGGPGVATIAWGLRPLRLPLPCSLPLCLVGFLAFRCSFRAGA